jgi:hypothetical protein
MPSRSRAARSHLSQLTRGMETTLDPAAYITPALGEAFPQMRFLTVTALGIRVSKLKATLSKRKARDHEALLGRQELIEQRVACCGEFFARAGYEFPLAGQLARTIDGGFPEARPIVGALVRCELLTGALMGVHDADSVSGDVLLDRVVREGERFDGMRGVVECPEGEIVVRDDRGVIASLFQGPDKRTGVEKHTSNVTFSIFDVPGLGAGLHEAEHCLVEMLDPCSTAMRCAHAQRAR